MLVKISLGGRLDTEGIVAQVDSIEVVQQNLGFIHHFLKLVGQILFLDLSLDPVLCGLVGPVCENIVLDQLLCDRTGSLGKIKSAGDADIEGPENAGDVDASVLVEALILDRDESVLQVFRDSLPGDRDAVGIR